jgi:hypothetical protein
MITPTNEFIENGRIQGPRGVPYGAFQFKRGSASLRVIASAGGGWDHVSVSLSTRTPTWEEMCWVKNKFFWPNEVVMQLHPAESNYVNNHRFCLHLWRPQPANEIERERKGFAESGETFPEWERPGQIPLPPEIAVGVKELGVL